MRVVFSASLWEGDNFLVRVPLSHCTTTVLSGVVVLPCRPISTTVPTWPSPSSWFPHFQSRPRTTRMPTSMLPLLGPGPGAEHTGRGLACFHECCWVLETSTNTGRKQHLCVGLSQRYSEELLLKSTTISDIQSHTLITCG
uniref:Uncharacterized protein n=1 Tax=Cyclopterus lumpus TaxID=8103 RepID=A0A8C2ZXR4_CYCLU